MARRFGGWRSACARCSRLRAMTLPPLSLYLHLPWCVRKCPYCDFNSHTLGAEDQTDRYVQALCSDLQLEAAAGRAAGRTIDTVFFGGGTPSLFSPGQIAALLEAIGALLTVSPRAEITMEANPGTIEHGRLADYSLAGINRLSLGAQSFDPDMLERLGRIHAPGDIIAACDEASQAGFAAINLDLISYPFQHIFVSGNEDNLVSAKCQLAGRRLANAAGGASDNGNLIQIALPGLGMGPYRRLFEHPPAH